MIRTDPESVFRMIFRPGIIACERYLHAFDQELGAGGDFYRKVIRPRTPVRTICWCSDDVSEGKELAMSLPLQPMPVKCGEVSGDFTTDRVIIEAVEKRLSLAIAAHEGHVKNIRRSLKYWEGRACSSLCTRIVTGAVLMP